MTQPPLPQEQIVFPTGTITNPATPSATIPPIKTPPSKATPSAIQKVCPMDAKECPNGTYVGKTGPNCEFVACPK